MILLHTVFFTRSTTVYYLRIESKIFSSSSLAHIILAYLSWPTEVHAHLISFKLKLRIFQSKNDGEKKFERFQATETIKMKINWSIEDSTDGLRVCILYTELLKGDTPTVY